METSAKLYSLPFGNVKTYLFALLFVAGNIALPQLCHLVPAGGPTLLPIYFFTLIAAYKYGFKIIEVPVIFINRELGTSKMNSSIFGEAVFGVIKLKVNSWFHKFPQKK